MTTQQLIGKFSHSINWNAFFYVVYKSAYTLLSLVLFTRISTTDYATWANTNSIIFLSLLWIDCGLRKSIPRFCPAFATSAHSHHSFVRSLIIFQAVLLVLALPFYSMVASSCAAALHLSANRFFFQASAAIFFLEGIVAIMRLMYHAHFWNKQFNLICMAALVFEMTINGALILQAATSYQLLCGLMVSKALGSLIIIIGSFFSLKGLTQTIIYNGQTKADNKQLWQAFIKHSGIMGANNIIKSLSERNFLLPVLTATIGPAQANLFKVANDGALLFYRSVLKTIGITDTALLAHTDTVIDKENAMSIAFKKLTTQIAALCLPLLGFLFLLSVPSQAITLRSCVFQTFFILTLSYLCEAMLSPYERVLEVKSRYMTLLYAYMPYLLVLGILYTYNLISLIGLVGSIALIQGVRLVSASIMVYCARREYGLSFPLAGVSKFFIAVTPVYITFFCIMRYSGMGRHIGTITAQYVVPFLIK